MSGDDSWDAEDLAPALRRDAVDYGSRPVRAYFLAVIREDGTMQSCLAPGLDPIRRAEAVGAAFIGLVCRGVDAHGNR